MGMRSYLPHVGKTSNIGQGVISYYFYLACFYYDGVIIGNLVVNRQYVIVVLLIVLLYFTLFSLTLKNLILYSVPFCLLLFLLNLSSVVYQIAVLIVFNVCGEYFGSRFNKSIKQLNIDPFEGLRDIETIIPPLMALLAILVVVENHHLNLLLLIIMLYIESRMIFLYKSKWGWIDRVLTRRFIFFVAKELKENPSLDANRAIAISEKAEEEVIMRVRRVPDNNTARLIITDIYRNALNENEKEKILNYLISIGVSFHGDGHKAIDSLADYLRVASKPKVIIAEIIGDIYGEKIKLEYYSHIIYKIGKERDERKI